MQFNIVCGFSLKSLGKKKSNIYESPVQLIFGEMFES